MRCHLPSALKRRRGQHLSLSSETTVPVCKSSRCQDSPPRDVGLNDTFGQHFHWGKFPLGYSDDIKCGLDVQIKLKPQNGGKGDGSVAPDLLSFQRKDSTSPTPFTLVSASFRRWLEPNHLLQTCNLAGFLVPQPVSLTKEGRNLPFPQHSWTGMKLNSMNLEFFAVNKASFSSQLLPVHGCYSALGAGQTLQSSEAGVSPLGPAVQTCPGAEGRRVLAQGFGWLTRLSLLGIQGKLSNANIGLVLPHQK